MNTYAFAEKNGSAGLILSADTQDEAWDTLKSLVKDPEAWRLDYTSPAINFEE